MTLRPLKAFSSNRENPMPPAGANGIELKTFRITSTRADLDNFFHLVEYIPELSVRESAVTATETSDRQEFGQLDVISVMVEFGLAIGAHATWDMLKTRIDSFREGRRHFIVEEIVIVQDDQRAAVVAGPADQTEEGDELRAATE
jgi:hypothetical protein